MGAIYRREMGAFFTSGTGYVFLSVFALLSGIFFCNNVIAMGTTNTSGLFTSMFTMVLFLIPILTMKLLSEEKKNRTDQGLLTAPIGLWSIVMGKYFSALTLFTIAESIVFIYSLILAYLGNVAWSILLGNYFAMLFLGAAFIAVGLFVSSVTENQITSAIVSMLALYALFMFDSLSSRVSVEFISKIMNSLSFYSKYSEFTQGVFSLPSVVFFISTAFLFNFFTVRVLDKRRWG